MLRKFLNSQISYVYVTECHEASPEEKIVIDSHILESANMMPGEQVEVIHIDSGQAMPMIVAEARSESRAVVVYGSQARHIHIGDRLVLRTYGYVENARALTHEPIRCRVNEQNDVIEALRQTYKLPLDDSSQI